jgi:hypothetical protein
MTRLRTAARIGLAGGIVATSFATSPGCDSCNPVRLKEWDLKPIGLPTEQSGPMGSDGYCLSKGSLPPSSYSAGKGQMMVGFDNAYKKGTNPLPCDDLRANVFRGGVLFDLSSFDVLATANLSFDTVFSVSRAHGEPALGRVPGTSFATTLGISIAIQASDVTMPETNLAPLPAGPHIDVGVSGQVEAWLTKAVPNFGFVVGGPTGLVDVNDPPENNDALLSWYQNFNLHVVYNPALNSRAPQ